MNAKSNLLQAAVILKSLPKSQAARILSRLEACDIQSVLDTINKIDDVSANQIVDSIEKLNREARKLKTPSAKPNSAGSKSGGPDGSKGSKSASQPSDRPEKKYPFDFLLDAPATIRQRLIVDEHPQNIAIILASLPPELSSECMRALEPVLRFSVLRRLCELDEISDASLTELSFALKLRYRKLMNRSVNRNTGVSSAAEVLSCADRNMQQALLDHMRATDPDLADDLQRSVLTMDHLVEFSDEEIKLLLRHVDTSCWAPALKRCPLKVQKRILDNMATTPASLLNAEMATIGQIDEGLAGQAEKQVVNAIVKLIRNGAIRPNREDSSAVFPRIVGPAIQLDPIVSPNS